MANKQPKWLLEDEIFEEDLQPIHDELDRLGYEYRIIKYIPFGKLHLPEDFKADDCVITYGSLNLIQKLQDTHPSTEWIPGWWCTLPNFLCTTYFTHFGKYLFNSQYVFVTVAEFLRMKDWLFSTLGIDDCIFVRPNTGLKTFTGQILEHEYLEKDWSWISEFSSPEDLILVSSPKHIDMEWRLIIAHKQVIAASQYKTYEPTTRKLGVDPAPGCPDETIAFATQIAQAVDWEPDPLYVMDVCLSNGEYYLLEINAFSTSGWYDCNPSPIIKSANLQAITEWEKKHV